MTTIRLPHVKVSLALHQLREGRGHPLLLLHGLGEHSPTTLPEHVAGWDGDVFALDFTGHGESTIPAGGGYTAEALMGDADAALAHLSAATLLGRGLGAYIALLLAGARPEHVRGAILADGPGLAGGGPSPGSPIVALPGHGREGPPDPFALLELARELRPPEYALVFLERAAERGPVSPTCVVTAVARPPWLAAVVAHDAAVELPMAEALALYAPPG